MRNATVAEWTLTLVVDPGRAAAAVGDLLEEDRGSVRFWSSILQTAASHIVHEIWHHPFAMLRVALAVFLEILVLALPVFLVINLIIKAWTGFAPYHVTPTSDYIPPWVYYCLIVGIPKVIFFFAGWEVARQSQGRELPAGVGVLALYATLSVVTAPGRGPADHIYPVPSCLEFLGPLCYLFGVVLCRLRAHRRPQTAK